MSCSSTPVPMVFLRSEVGVCAEQLDEHSFYFKTALSFELVDGLTKEALGLVLADMVISAAKRLRESK